MSLWIQLGIEYTLIGVDWSNTIRSIQWNFQQVIVLYRWKLLKVIHTIQTRHQNARSLTQMMKIKILQPFRNYPERFLLRNLPNQIIRFKLIFRRFNAFSPRSQFPIPFLDRWLRYVDTFSLCVSLVSCKTTLL